MQMQETARHSLMSLPMGAGSNSQRNSVYSNGMGSDESQIPLTGASKSSGLRHYISDDGLSDEGVMMRDRRGDQGRF